MPHRIDANCANPGLAKLGLTPAQALAASTINSAHAIGMAHRVGSLEVGKAADFVIYDAPNLDFVAYHFGVNLAQHVFKQGRQVVHDGHLVYGAK